MLINWVKINRLNQLKCVWRYSKQRNFIISFYNFYTYVARARSTARLNLQHYLLDYWCLPKNKITVRDE